jgi:hypothetical protein
MKLTNRDAMAYVLWRWAHQNRLPLNVQQAEDLVDEMLAMCPEGMSDAAARAWKRRRRRGPRAPLAKPAAVVTS